MLNRPLQRTIVGSYYQLSLPTEWEPIENPAPPLEFRAEMMFDGVGSYLNVQVIPSDLESKTIGNQMVNDAVANGSNVRHVMETASFQHSGWRGVFEQSDGLTSVPTIFVCDGLALIFCFVFPTSIFADVIGEINSITHSISIGVQK